jgi:hypothetical protein
MCGRLSSTLTKRSQTTAPTSEWFFWKRVMEPWCAAGCQNFAPSGLDAPVLPCDCQHGRKLEGSIIAWKATARKKLKEKPELFSHLTSINQIHPAKYILLNSSHWSARYNDALRALSQKSSNVPLRSKAVMGLKHFSLLALQELTMKEAEVLSRALAMPLTSPAYPKGPYRFYNREFLTITYRTDPRSRLPRQCK